ncbi:MAG: glycosyltransferase family 4 protein [Tsuneonella sp.]
MRIAFDLHNIRDGGGPNYIRNILRVAEPTDVGIDEVILIGSREVLSFHPDRPFVKKVAVPALEGGLVSRLRFVALEMPRLLRELSVDLLYVPGGLAFGNFRPYATISRNMMPFSPELWGQYPAFSFDRFRLHALRRLNARTFARSDGMIFLTETARAAITPTMSRLPREVAVIAHGVDHERFRPPALLRKIEAGLGRETTARIVYPSRFEPYKHQVEVIAALDRLREAFPLLQLDLCGPANPDYFARFQQELTDFPDLADSVRYLGEIPNADLPALYADADLMVFASSCENLPNILIEALACGIPIVCSNRSPMPEVAQDACVYFDPADPTSIADAIREALENPRETLERAARGIEIAADYNWRRCADRTFALLATVAGSGHTGD